MPAVAAQAARSARAARTRFYWVQAHYTNRRAASRQLSAGSRQSAGRAATGCSKRAQAALSTAASLPQRCGCARARSWTVGGPDRRATGAGREVRRYHGGQSAVARAASANLTRLMAGRSCLFERALQFPPASTADLAIDLGESRISSLGRDQISLGDLPHRKQGLRRQVQRVILRQRA